MFEACFFQYADKYFELLTDISLDEIKKLKEEKISPINLKVRLAKEIVKMYHGEKNAEMAEEEFNKVFRNREMPTDLPIFETDKKQYFVLDLLFDAKLASSKNEAKRLVEGGGVELQIKNSKFKIQNWREDVKIEDGMIIKVGSRRFVKIKLK